MANVCWNVPVIGTGLEDVYVYQETTSTSTAIRTIATYTVPAGQNFYLISYSFVKITNPGAYGTPFTLQANGVNIRRTSVQNVASVGYGNFFIWSEVIPFPLYVATTRQVVRIRVTPSSNVSTTWGASIIGGLKPI